jgi:hypothetical protein
MKINRLLKIIRRYQVVAQEARSVRDILEKMFMSGPFVCRRRGDTVLPGLRKRAQCRGPVTGPTCHGPVCNSVLRADPLKAQPVG